jgi:hypothetical protein
VDLCKRVNAQGNTIAIRMLEYLSTAKTPIHGFETLAREFIELCQVRPTDQRLTIKQSNTHC